MAQYFSPGVYIEEVETGPVPIQGVATNITGAVGVTVRGPTSGKPILVTSFNDFQNTFGGFFTVPSDSVPLDAVASWGASSNKEGGNWWQFPLSVKGYFDNGGLQLYVKRVFSGAAQPAQGTFFQGLVSEITKDWKLSDPSATSAVLTLRHLFGIDAKPKETTTGTNILTINAGGAYSWRRPLQRPKASRSAPMNPSG